MKYKDLIDIIKTGEGYTIELKRSLNDSVGKEICAFANSSGGKIILGVDANVYTNVDAKSNIRHKKDGDVDANVYANVYANPSLRQNWILQYLRNNKKVTAKIIFEKFNLSKVSVSRDLRKLIADEKIVRKGGGNNVWYELK